MPGVYALLRAHDAALVVANHPRRAFQTRALTARWTFLRFHYGRRWRNGNYSATELACWASTIARWRTEVYVYAYFNNDWEAFAVRNALRLRAAVAAAVPR